MGTKEREEEEEEEDFRQGESHFQLVPVDSDALALRDSAQQQQQRATTTHTAADKYQSRRRWEEKCALATPSTSVFLFTFLPVSLCVCAVLPFSSAIHQSKREMAATPASAERDSAGFAGHEHRNLFAHILLLFIYKYIFILALAAVYVLLCGFCCCCCFPASRYKYEGLISRARPSIKA